MKLLIDGAASLAELPALDISGFDGEIAFSPDIHALREQLPDATILLDWGFRGREFEAFWHEARELRWIHRCGAGVDAMLFPALQNSDVVLTNARGIFDRAMAEYVLGYMLYEVKHFGRTLKAQQRHQWDPSTTGKLNGQKAAIFGVGSIGREIARLLQVIGLQVIGVGRTQRDGDSDFGRIYGVGDALSIAAGVDWVIGVLPSTPESDGLFNADFFAAMRAGARFINVGRGAAQDETALCAALQTGGIAGAMLDVFCQEPLPPTSPLWDTPKVFLSPHISGGNIDHQEAIFAQFWDNLQRFTANRPLLNRVDKKLGFVVS